MVENVCLQRVCAKYCPSGLANVSCSLVCTHSPAANSVAEQRRKRIQELEYRVSQLRKKVDEQTRVIRLKEDAERSAKKLQQEISVRTVFHLPGCLSRSEASSVGFNVKVLKGLAFSYLENSAIATFLS